ncbi:right-handed parallel beta-helix repeat-containing protein [Bacteroidota bacterium]
MKRYLLLIAILSLFSTIYSQTDITAGAVSGIWTKGNSPYNVYGDIYVQANQLLKIEPGVKVVFHGHYRLKLLNANLLAVGNIDDTIVFTVADTNGYANGIWNEGGWNGIGFSYASTADSSKISYCRFEYAKIPWNEFGNDQGVIQIQRFPKLTIQYCQFIHNMTQEGGIIDIAFSNVTIRHNVFRQNKSYHILTMEQDSPEIYGNRIDSNECNIVFWIKAWNNPRIHHNMIIHNTAIQLIRTYGNCRPRIYQNWILNNTAASILYFEKSKTELLNNLVANNDGEVIHLSDGDETVIMQNTVAYNDGPIMVMHKASSNLISGNIFNGNASYIDYIKGSMEPSFLYNMFDFPDSLWTGEEFTGIYEYNQESSPHFVLHAGGVGRSFDAEFTDFNIAPGANVVNRGDPEIPEKYITPDLYDRDRIRYGRIDVGAYEANLSGDTIPIPLLRDTILTADTIFVKGNFVIPDDVTLKISARAVVLFNGPDSIIVNGSLQAIGTEEEPIRFTTRDTAGFSNPTSVDGSWRGIILDNTSGDMDDNEPSIFDHCIFQYAKSPGRPGGVFNLRHLDNFILRNSEFRYNYAFGEGLAISAWDSDFKIGYCSFHHHKSEGASIKGTLSFTNCSIYIDNCTFYANTANDGASLYIFDSDIKLSNSHFFNNQSIGWGQAPALSSLGSDVVISNCLINNNKTEDSGVMDFQSSRVYIHNSTIVNNSMLGVESAGISLERSELTIYNSILYGNHSDQDSSSITLLEDNSDPDLYNTLIQGGLRGIKTWEGFSYTGEFVDCIDEFPHFVSPSLNTGVVDSSQSGNWRLRDISPCINSGTTDTIGLNLPSSDLAGNKRIMYDRIDMGAYEKTGKPPEVFTQPAGGNFCADDSIVLIVQYYHSDTAFLQWQKDGTDIPGAVNEKFVLFPAELDHTGNYTCRIKNSFGTVNSLQVFVNIKDPPLIQSQPKDAWVEPDKSITLEVQNIGSQPMDINWKLNGKDLGVNVPGYSFTPSDSSYEGVYQCELSNACGTVSTEPVSIYLAPQICVVTVSTTTGYNLIVWEKKTKAPITAYNVYRESSAAGIYDRLATLSADDLSLYVDTVADPTVQGYIYRITALDTAGIESDADLCKSHKTIHLLVSTNPELNTTQLEWDRYVGFEYLTYKIYRSNTTTDLQEVHSLSSSFNSWTDPDPVAGKQYYRISVERLLPCIPEGAENKAGTGPYQHALSNMDDNKLKTGVRQKDVAQDLLIFPNPISSETTLKFPNPEKEPFQLTITNLDGKVVITKNNIRSEIFTVKTDNLQKGCYIFEVRGTHIYRGIGIVEE